MYMNSNAKFLFFALRSSGSARWNTEGTKNAMETTSTLPSIAGRDSGGDGAYSLHHRAAIMQNKCKYILQLPRVFRVKRQQRCD